MKSFTDYLDSILNESKESRELMKKQNLTYAGYGVYKDKQGNKYEYEPRSKRMKKLTLDTIEKLKEKIYTGKTLQMTLQQCIKLMKNHVLQYHNAGKNIYNYGYYRRGRNYNPQEGLPLHDDIYYLSNDGEIKTLCYNTSHRRASQLLKALKNKTLKNINSEIIANYVTNGYNTRRGLFANYDKNIKNIKKIAQSHANYMGAEVNSTIDHINRSFIRKNE